MRRTRLMIPSVSTLFLGRLLLVLGVLTLAVDVYVLWPNNGGGDQSIRLLPQPQPLIPGVISSIQNNMHPLPKDPTVKRLSNDKSAQQEGAAPSSITAGKEPVIQLLQKAGITISDEKILRQLPTWAQVVQLYGKGPVIGGLESCARFRESVPEVQRMLGSAGMFSTGTNLVTHLLKQNCQIPARVKKYGIKASKEQHGMRWQVPWGKHTDASFRNAHSTEKAKAIKKEDMLPVVTIRNPWRWMQSMCKNPYTARWPHSHQCPNLIKADKNGRNDGDGTKQWNNVTVKYGAGTMSYQSLAHLWNDWYRAYQRDADYPLVMIRMEDLVFHTKPTITAVCECAGGRIRTDRPFTYILDSAKKDSPGHDTSTGLTEAWIKYSRPLQDDAGFAHNDYKAALEALDQDLMEKFHYRHPPSSISV